MGDEADRVVCELLQLRDRVPSRRLFRRSAAEPPDRAISFFGQRDRMQAAERRVEQAQRARESREMAALQQFTGDFVAKFQPETLCVRDVPMQVTPALRCISNETSPTGHITAVMP